MHTIAQMDLSRWTQAIFRHAGLSANHAAMVAEVLVRTSLRGIDTHGVSRVPTYLELLAQGDTKAVPDIRIEQRGAVIEVDADFALGQVAGTLATQAAIDRAEREGVAIAVIRNIGHLGALGHYAGAAAQRGLIGVILQNAPPNMGVEGSTAAAIGNSPIAFAAPVVDGPSIVFDIATSEAALGKIMEAARSGAAIPAGWALDAQGRPTTDSVAALKGMLLPMAGAKGVGLAMLIETLAGSLTGVRPAQHKRGAQLSSAFGAFMLVLDPDQIVGRAAFDDHLSGWLETYRRSSPTARYPGERSAQIEQAREKDGVPLEPKVVAALRAVGEAAGVPFAEA